MEETFTVADQKASCSASHQLACLSVGVQLTNFGESNFRFMRSCKFHSSQKKKINFLHFVADQNRKR